MRADQRKDRRRATPSDAEQRLPAPICYQMRYLQTRASDPLLRTRTNHGQTMQLCRARPQRPPGWHARIYRRADTADDTW